MAPAHETTFVVRSQRLVPPPTQPPLTFGGAAGNAWLVRVRPAAAALDVAAPLLGLDPAALGGARRPRLGARAPDLERRGEPAARAARARARGCGAGSACPARRPSRAGRGVHRSVPSGRPRGSPRPARRRPPRRATPSRSRAGHPVRRTGWCATRSRRAAGRDFHEWAAWTRRHNFRPCQRLESAVPQPGTGADCTWKHPPFAHRRDSAVSRSRSRCCACGRTTSCSPSSAPAPTRRSTSSTTATASGCSPTSARCSRRSRARTPRTCCRTSSCAPSARCAPTRARSTCAPGSTASPTTAASTTCAGPSPPPADVFEMSRTPLHDPVEDAQRREDLQRLVTDVGRLPEQQRSALLMREIDGMSYADLAGALDVTVPAVKSLLVRARLGLVEAAEARSTDCVVIREDLAVRLRPRRQGLRPGAPAHARVLRLPRVPQRPAQRPLLLRRAVARRRRRRGADGEAVRDRRRRRGRRRRGRQRRRRAGGRDRRGRRDRLQGRRRRLHGRADRGRRRRGQDRSPTTTAPPPPARRSPPRPRLQAQPEHAPGRAHERRRRRPGARSRRPSAAPPRRPRRASATRRPARTTRSSRRPSIPIYAPDLGGATAPRRRRCPRPAA